MERARPLGRQIFWPRQLGGAIRTNECGKQDFQLFLLDRQTFRADVDVDALGRLFAGLIELVTQRSDRDHQRADDEIENILASHCEPQRIFFCDPSPVEAPVKSGLAWARHSATGLAGGFAGSGPGRQAPDQDFVKCARCSLALTSRRDLRRECANG